ncbi:MAG: matrixin family metalloprotease [Gammaproteobacteria bacterium]|nr:matrixin family metalloprotease [Gammaproteobacteria bacterium]
MRRLAPTACAVCLIVLPSAAGAYAFFGQPSVASSGPQPLQTDTNINPVVWPDAKLVVEMTLNFSDAYKASLLDAMQTSWNAVGTPLQFQEGASAAQPCDKITGTNAADGINAAGFRQTTCAGQAFGDALAVTQVTHVRRNGRWELSDTDIMVDQSRPWIAQRSGQLQSGTYDFHRVIIHELGHALGLEHPNDAFQQVTAIMNSQVSDVETLQTDDIQGVEFLYEGANSSTSAVSQNDSAGADGALAALALLGWGARRAFCRRGRRGIMRVQRDGKVKTCC